MMNVLFLFLLHTIAYADTLPFQHDVLCEETRPGTNRSSVKLSYDRAQHPELGRSGQIVIELNTGFGDLANIAQSAGTDKPYGRVLHTEGAAGQVGNYMAQDEKDPFVISSKLGFGTLDLLDAAGKPEKKLAYFLNTVNLSRVQERFLDNSFKVSTRDVILLEISGGLDGYGHFFERFDVSDCHTLN